MQKRISRILSAAVSLAILGAAAAAPLQASAWSAIPGTGDWVAMPGNLVNKTATPAKLSLGADGLTITYTGGEYTPGGDNAGVMYAKPVDLNDFSVEFTVTKKAGDYNLQNTGVDSWISLCLLNKKDKYFNVNKAGQSQGIVTLIRPMGSTTAFEINQLTNSWSTASRRSYPYEGAMNTTFKVEIKKGTLDGDDTYDFFVNGQKVDFAVDAGAPFQPSFVTLMEKGEVYFYMGVSCKDDSQQIEWRINKINGQPVKADESVKPTSPQPDDTTTAPQQDTTTNDSSADTTTGNGETTGSTPSDSSTGKPTDATGGSRPTGTQPGETTGTVPDNQDTDTAGGANVGLIVGIVVAAVVILGGGGTGLFFYLKKRRAV